MNEPVVSIVELGRHAGENVTLKGWVYHHRSKGKIVFLVLRDGSGLAQCVIVKGGVDDAAFAEAEKLPLESSIEVTGAVRLDPRAPGAPSSACGACEFTSARISTIRSNPRSTGRDSWWSTGICGFGAGSPGRA